MARIVSKRERYIAIGAAAAVVLLLLNYFILSPYTDQSRELDTKSAALTQNQADANALFDREAKLTKPWKQMQKALNVDPSTAESEAEQAVIDWADTSGLTLTGLRPGKTSQENGFVVINFTATGTGSMPDIAHMLWALESASIPVRVSDLQLKPRKEGTDDLLATFTVSVLCLPPSTETPEHALTSASAWNRDIAP